MRVILFIISVCGAHHLHLLASRSEPSSAANSSLIVVQTDGLQLSDADSDIVHAQVFNQILGKAVGAVSNLNAMANDLVSDPIDFVIEADRKIDSRIHAFEDRIDDAKQRMVDKKDEKLRSVKEVMVKPIQLAADLADIDDGFDLDAYVAGAKYNDPNESGYRTGM